LIHLNASNKQHFLIGDININIETHNNALIATASNYINTIISMVHIQLSPSHHVYQKTQVL